MKLLCKFLDVMDPSLRWGDELIRGENGGCNIQAPFPFCMIENRTGDDYFIGLRACSKGLDCRCHGLGIANGTRRQDIV